MYLIDARRKNKELIRLAKEAKDRYRIQLVDFYRLATITAYAIEITPITRKSQHYATDMSTLTYVTDEIIRILGEDYLDREYRGLHALIGVAGTAMRSNLPPIDEDTDLRRLRVAPDLLKGLIYARER
ncbi:hypothetical protein DTU56_24945 [Salmonella enterica subsp. enterica serovar Muenchen]|uniref:Uncharacterized protein n=1 Tax=Salmonella muenchen TaxID=596 RepID=A0A5U8XTC7_SALMU|nr:hypothetical protein [Salmonella enterica subsp. enterica serovar Muenchen]EGO2129916.1 hypothetical protein [Salmonella enterica]QFP93222.1 hypothetical protein [Serratia phage PCH45]